jgi:hypothetical protein
VPERTNYLSCRIFISILETPHGKGAFPLRVREIHYLSIASRVKTQSWMPEARNISEERYRPMDLTLQWYPV